MLFKAHTGRSYLWLAATSRWEHFDYFVDVLSCDSQHKPYYDKRRTLSLDKDIRDRIENLCRLISWGLKPCLRYNISPLQILQQNFYCFVYQHDRLVT